MKYIKQNDGVYFVWSEILADFSFISFFCLPLERIFINRLNFLNYEPLTIFFMFFIPFVPAVIAMCFNPSWFRALKEFSVIFIGLIGSLAVTLLIHPDYLYWYTRPTYGVIPYVLRPHNGIYAYFFIRLINDPHRILKDLRISGLIMYVFYLWRFMNALRDGYWVYESSTGEMINVSYNLDFGYDVMFFAIPFLYLAITEHKLIDVAASILGIVMCFAAGSRGPVLILGMFFFYCVFNRIRRSRWGLLYGALIVMGIIVLVLFLDQLFELLKVLLDSLGIQSRTLDMLLDGTASSDSGRSLYWDTAIEMIKEKPYFGYGAMGARPVLSKLHVAAYPHQMFLELMVEYGLFGAAISAFLIIGSLRVFLMPGIGRWKDIFAIFFANAMELMLSYTYWHKYALWAALAAGVCAVSYYHHQEVRIDDPVQSDAALEKRYGYIR